MTVPWTYTPGFVAYAHSQTAPLNVLGEKMRGI
jgi:hypothetical protein